VRNPAPRSAGTLRYRVNPWSKALLYVITWMVCLLFLFPFLSMVSTALKSYMEATSLPVHLVPVQWHWENFPNVMKKAPLFARWFLNSFILSILPTIGIVLASSLAGFAFARLRARFKKQLFGIVLATLMIPTTSMFVPMYIFWRGFHAIGTYWPLILPAFFGDAFNVFLFRQFFAGMPKELEEAAIVEGCGRFRVWWSIFMPNALAVIATSAIWHFNWRWNEFMMPRFFLNSMQSYPVSVGILYAFTDEFAKVQVNMVSAGALVFAIPTIIVFMLGQKYLVQGFVTSGIKG
jgi:multiple sugar transport system permease protein